MPINDALWSISYFYATEGIINGLFSGLLPNLKEHYSLDDETVGLVLMFCTVGSLMAVPVMESDMMTKSVGSKRNILLTSSLYCMILPLLFCAKNELLLIGVSYAFGFTYSFFSIACVAQACLYEKASGKNTMGYFTAVYASGEMLGSGLTGILYTANISGFNIALSGAIVLGVCNLVGYRGLFSNKDEKDIANNEGPNSDKDMEAQGEGLLEMDMKSPDNGSNNSRKPFPERVVERKENTNGVRKVDVEQVAIADTDAEDECTALEELGPERVESKDMQTVMVLIAIGALSWLLEGSVSAWSAMYVLSLSGSKGISVCGVWIYTFASALSCLNYDKLIETKKISRNTLLKTVALGACLGYFLVACSAMLSEVSRTAAVGVTLVGFFVVGFCVSPLHPLVLFASSRVRGFDGPKGIALVAGYSNIGLLVGPPMLGVISHLSGSISWTFVAAGCLSALILPLGGRLRLE